MVVYAATIVGAGLASAGLTAYVLVGRRMCARSMSSGRIRYSMVRSLVVPMYFAASLLLFLFSVPPNVVELSWIGILVVNVLVARALPHGGQGVVTGEGRDTAAGRLTSGIMDRLAAMGSEAARAGMARYGINVDDAFGVSVYELQADRDRSTAATTDWPWRCGAPATTRHACWRAWSTTRRR